MLCALPFHELLHREIVQGGCALCVYLLLGPEVFECTFLHWTWHSAKSFPDFFLCQVLLPETFESPNRTFWDFCVFAMRLWLVHLLCSGFDRTTAFPALR